MFYFLKEAQQTKLKEYPFYRQYLDLYTLSIRAILAKRNVDYSLLQGTRKTFLDNLEGEFGKEFLRKKILSRKQLEMMIAETVYRDTTYDSLFKVAQIYSLCLLQNWINKYDNLVETYKMVSDSPPEDRNTSIDRDLRLILGHIENGSKKLDGIGLIAATFRSGMIVDLDGQEHDMDSIISDHENVKLVIADGQRFLHFLDRLEQKDFDYYPWFQKLLKNFYDGNLSNIEPVFAQNDIYRNYLIEILTIAPYLLNQMSRLGIKPKHPILEDYVSLANIKIFREFLALHSRGCLFEGWTKESISMHYKTAIRINNPLLINTLLDHKKEAVETCLRNPDAWPLARKAVKNVLRMVNVMLDGIISDQKKGLTGKKAELIAAIINTLRTNKEYFERVRVTLGA